MHPGPRIILQIDRKQHQRQRRRSVAMLATCQGSICSNLNTFTFPLSGRSGLFCSYHVRSKHLCANVGLPGEKDEKKQLNMLSDILVYDGDNSVISFTGGHQCLYMVDLLLTLSFSLIFYKCLTCGSWPSSS